MRFTLVLLTLLLTGLPAWALSASEAITLAVRDARTLPVTAQPVARYLWLHESTGRERQATWQTLSAHVNSLSREPDLTPPVVILETGQAVAGLTLPVADWSKAALVRLLLTDYRWDRDTYEGLAKQDFYFHQLIAQELGYTDAYGRWVTTRTVQTPAIASWVATADMTELVNVTQSSVPILRGDNFFWQTSLQFNRTVGYYGLLDVKNRKDFERLIGFDRKVSADFSRELLAAVANSGIARVPRRIEQQEKPGGEVWITYDNDVLADATDPLRVLDRANFQHKAEEWYGHLANGLWAVGLFDADGTRQDTAPDFIGGDRHTHNVDTRIHIYLSCVRCHRTGGLLDVKDWARNLYARRRLALTSPLVDVERDLAAKYLKRRLEPALDRGRGRYTAALLEASGRTPEDHADALAGWYAAIDGPVSLARAAADLGVTPADFRAALETYLLANPGAADVVLTGYLLPGAEQEPLPADQWFRSIPLAQQIMGGAKKRGKP